jgi:hypothetical protein
MGTGALGALPMRSGLPAAEDGPKTQGASQSTSTGTIMMLGWTRGMRS